MHKLAVIGAGRVGEAVALTVAQKEICREIVLLDVQPDMPQGVALDIAETGPFWGFDTQVTGSNDPQDIAGADIIVVTAGIARKPGMSRSDVLETNLKIIDSICDDIMRYAPDAIIIVVSNPVDVMTFRTWQRTGWDRSRVIGQAGVLDAARMATFIAMETGFSVRDITTIVLGGHGDTMVPLARFCTINGLPISTFISDEKIEAINERTRNGGAEVLALRKNSSAYDAPGVSTAVMVDSIINNRRRIVPSVTILDGEYGETGIAMGVPCILSQTGAESIVELSLTDEEMQAFKTSANAVRADIERI